MGKHIGGGEEAGKFDTFSRRHPSTKWLGSAFIMWWFSRLKFCFQDWKHAGKRHKLKEKVQKSAQIPFCGQPRAFRYEIVFRGIQPYLFYTFQSYPWEANRLFGLKLHVYRVFIYFSYKNERNSSTAFYTSNVYVINSYIFACLHCLNVINAYMPYFIYSFHCTYRFLRIINFKYYYYHYCLL